MCFWWWRWYIQDGARSVSGSYFVPMNFVKSNKKNNSKISLWYKLTYAGMCIKFRSKTDLERRFPRRDCFWWRGWYIQDSAPSVWGNTRQNLRLLFEFCKEGTFTQSTDCGYPTWPYLAQLSAQIRPNTVLGARNRVRPALWKRMQIFTNFCFVGGIIRTPQFWCHRPST